ncbi:hypothetical protein HKD37_14G039656 [Glycine soja]
MLYSHPDVVKLTNYCNLVFLIDSTYKTNEYKLLLFDIVALQHFRGLFMRVDALLGVIVTDRDLSLMNAVKTIFPNTTNLLCRFHIDKNVKAKCKTLGSLVDCPCESSFDEYLKKFEMACSLWPIFVDYVCQTWVIPHKENFVKAWTNKVMHLENTTTNRLLQNSLGDICNVWEAMNNMMTLQHTHIKASFETSTHVVGHVFKVTLYKKLLGMILRYALNEIAAEYECVYLMQAKTLYVVNTIHIFWWRLNFSDQGLCEAKVTITEEMETISKRFEQLNVCGKVHLKTKLREIAYPEKVKTKGAPKKLMTKQQKSTKCDLSYWEYVDALHSVQNINSSVKRSASSSEQPIQKQNIPMLDQFHPYGYWAIAALLGMGEESWSLVCNHLHKELTKYINLLGDIKRFEELKCSLLVDGLSMVTMGKWMNVTDMGYVLLHDTISQSPLDSSVHCVICIGHVYENHFVHAKQWPIPYIGRIQRYKNLSRLKIEFVDLGEE